MKQQPPLSKIDSESSQDEFTARRNDLVILENKALEYIKTEKPQCALELLLRALLIANELQDSETQSNLRTHIVALLLCMERAEEAIVMGKLSMSDSCLAFFLGIYPD